MPMPKRTLISVVVPVFNEEENIRPFHDAMCAVELDPDIELEILFVDDGSSDASFERIAALRREDSRVRALRFSRNFGSHAALSAGLRAARGAAAMMISADLQDPPHLLHPFLEKWRAGHHVVWGVRETRDDPWLKSLSSDLFYKLLRRVALPNYPPRGMDCGLLDRKVIDTLNLFPEGNRLLPPIIVWAGYRSTEVPYHRQGRQFGVSKWSLKKRIKAAIDILVSFSHLPVQWISRLGFVVTLLSFLYASVIVTRRLFFDLGEVGWPSLMVAVLFLGGVQLMMLGLLGEYIWRAAEQVRGRPLYIVMEELGDGSDGEGDAND